MKTLTNHWPHILQAVLYDLPSPEPIDNSELEGLSSAKTNLEKVSFDKFTEPLVDDVVEFENLEEVAKTVEEAFFEELEGELHKPENKHYYETDDDGEEYHSVIFGFYDDDYFELDLSDLLDVEIEYSLQAEESLHQKDAVIYFLQMRMDPATMATRIYDPSDEEDSGQRGMYQAALNEMLMF